MSCYVIKVRRLLAVCPKNTGGTGGVFRVDQRGLDAIVALGIYHLESGLKASADFWLKLHSVYLVLSYNCLT